MTDRVDVPGKLVLVGEYAVLDGAPALAMAVTDGVFCEVEPDPGLEIETPDGDDRFVRAALNAIDAPPARYRFGARSSVDLPRKPGFGGSAAATVAALLAGGFAGDADSLANLAQRIHHGVQGSGSGVDVAVAARGGVLRIEGERADPVDLPVPVVVYSGQSARTGPRVQAYLAWSDREPFVRASRAWVDGFPADPAATARLAWRGLCAMAESAGFDYRTPGIDRIVALAEQHGGGAKPSGAGGGDCVVAWLPDPVAFREAVQREGFVILPVGVGGPPSVLSRAPRSPWGVFPAVLIHADVASVKQHPSYDAAKRGSVLAARELVRATISVEAVAQLRGWRIGERPTLLPVHALEESGVNAIPEVLAAELSERLGWPFATPVVQSNVVGHTGATGWARLARQARFHGAAPSTSFVLVDDFIGQGGTLANLRGHLLAQGATVLGATTLTGKLHSSVLALSAEALVSLRRRHGDELEVWWRSRFGHAFDCLTESEARFLTRAEDAHRVRARLAEEER